MRPHSKRTAGFTLIELMLVVAIIGALASIAIPSFLRYQNRSKRSEAFGNLVGIARAQESFFAANGVYVDSGVPQPAGLPGPAKQVWTPAADVAFASIGFRPEGNVFHTYDVSTACGCPACYTATSYGDVDGDGNVSAVMYVHRDAAGNVCQEGLGLGLGTPVENGVPVFDQVAWNALSDDF
jgi:type IV pilus assembly protein PilE